MKAKIKLAFRIVIDQNSEIVWDKYILEDTYFEYKIQHQVFDDKENPVKNYWELLRKNPHAEKIPFLLSSAVVNYVASLTVRSEVFRMFWEILFSRLKILSWILSAPMWKILQSIK